jgi:hypothetical protein
MAGRYKSRGSPLHGPSNGDPGVAQFARGRTVSVKAIISVDSHDRYAMADQAVS